MDVINGLPKWLRWILFLPAGIAAYFFVYIMVRLTMGFMFDYSNAFLITSCVFFSSLAMVVLSGLMAPAGRLGVSVAVGIINTAWAVIWFMGLLVLIADGTETVGLGWSIIATIAKIAAGWFGVSVVLAQVREDREKEAEKSVDMV